MNAFREAILQTPFTVSIEIVPGRGCGGTAIDAPAEFARRIAETGTPIRAISVTDNPGGNPAISPDSMALEIRKHGVEPIVNFACRDYNRNALESRAMALARNGINTLLAVTGDYPESGYRGVARPVFDLDSVQSISYLKAMNAGLEIPGRKKGTVLRLPPTDFFVGAAVSPFKLREDELLGQFLKLERKVAAGADLIIPQLGYDMRKFLEVKRYLDARGLNVPLFGNVYVLGAGTGRLMNRGAVPGCVVSDDLLKILEQEAASPDKGRAASLERAARMLAIFKGMGFRGAHLAGFALKFEEIQQILRRADEIAPQWESFVPEVSFGRPGEFYLFPEPTSYRPAAQPDPDPIPALRGGSEGLKSRLLRAVHNLIFVPDTPGYRILQRYYRAIEGKKAISAASHVFERAGKVLLVGCRDCGDCALSAMANCCPMSQCPKNLRNGPCGGTRKGQCEVYEDRPCVWTVVYRRLKATGRLEELRTGCVSPRDARLEGTSGWSNFYLGRDHQGRGAIQETPPGRH